MSGVKYIDHNGMKSVAFVGLGMILTPFLKALLSLTGRKNHRVFTTRGGALDWLSRD